MINSSIHSSLSRRLPHSRKLSATSKLNLYLTFIATTLCIFNIILGSPSLPITCQTLIYLPPMLLSYLMTDSYRTTLLSTCGVFQSNPGSYRSGCWRLGRRYFLTGRVRFPTTRRLLVTYLHSFTWPLSGHLK